MNTVKESLFVFKEGDILGGCSLYTVIGVLNRGSYGVVLLAYDSENSQVAIKVLFSQSVLEHATELEILSTLPLSKYTISYKTYFYENGYLFIFHIGSGSKLIEIELEVVNKTEISKSTY
ncbi:hypothetical protein PCK1_000771 [Pneumocystis canis]|nr:hypothetical protein PCK1_000771 [Pneumocystis canis]